MNHTKLQFRATEDRNKERLDRHRGFSSVVYMQKHLMAPESIIRH
jgi:hypothetical protein